MNTGNEKSDKSLPIRSLTIWKAYFISILTPSGPGIRNLNCEISVILQKTLLFSNSIFRVDYSSFITNKIDSLDFLVNKKKLLFLTK